MLKCQMLHACRAVRNASFRQIPQRQPCFLATISKSAMHMKQKARDFGTLVIVPGSLDDSNGSLQADRFASGCCPAPPLSQSELLQWERPENPFDVVESVVLSTSAAAPRRDRVLDEDARPQDPRERPTRHDCGRHMDYASQVEASLP
jgi:hypothetical protein